MLNINSTRKTIIDNINEIVNFGVNSEMVKIDNIPLGIVSYNNSEDRQAAIDAINIVLKNSRNSGMQLAMEVMDVFMTQAAMKEANANPAVSEEVEIDGIPVILEYAQRKAYIGGSEFSMEEIANIDDMACELPYEAIKTILIERATKKLNEEANN